MQIKEFGILKLKRIFRRIEEWKCQFGRELEGVAEGLIPSEGIDEGLIPNKKGITHW